MVVCLHFSTNTRFGERFLDGQYSLASILFAVLLLTVPACPAICKSGGHVPPVPYGVGATGHHIYFTQCYSQLIPAYRLLHWFPTRGKLLKLGTSGEYKSREVAQSQFK